MLIGLKQVLNAKTVIDRSFWSSVWSHYSKTEVCISYGISSFNTDICIIMSEYNSARLLNVKHCTYWQGTPHKPWQTWRSSYKRIQRATTQLIRQQQQPRTGSNGVSSVSPKHRQGPTLFLRQLHHFTMGFWIRVKFHGKFVELEKFMEFLALPAIISECS